jgi:Ca2+-binding RTX toxin-like protein
MASKLRTTTSIVALLAATSGMTALATRSSAAAAARPRCHGHVATIVGKSPSGKLVGTKHRDVIVGTGRQHIYGKGGNDIICAGPGFSRDGGANVHGGTGDDHIYGNGNEDAFSAFWGGTGKDLLVAGSRRDNLYGGTGADTLRGSRKRSALGFPGKGDDSVTNASVVDYEHAAKSVHVNLSKGIARGASIGEDTLVRVHGVVGTAENDTIIGTTGDDALDGGLGNDRILGLGGDDFIDARIGGFDRSAKHPTDNDRISGGSGDDLILDDGDSAGSSPKGNDTVTGGAGDDTFWVGGGTDTIAGGSGRDWIEGGPNNVANWTIDLAAGTATNANGVATFTGIENAQGAMGDDVIRGDDSANRLYGGTGSDQLFGEGGDDTLEGDLPNSPANPGDTADGGPGTDTCNATTTSNCEN